MDTMAKMAITLVVMSLFYWIWWRYRRLTLLLRCGIPMPDVSFWNGNFAELISKGNVPAKREWRAKYGKVFGFVFDTPTVSVADADLVRLIQVKVSVLPATASATLG